MLISVDNRVQLILKNIFQIIQDTVLELIVESCIELFNRMDIYPKHLPLSKRTDLTGNNLLAWKLLVFERNNSSSSLCTLYSPHNSVIGWVKADINI